MKYEEITGEKLEKLEQFIRGSMLGDGYLAPQRTEKTMSWMDIKHSPKQIEYLKWKMEVLEDCGIKCKMRSYTHYSDRYKSGECTTLSFSSRSHPVFSKFRSLYYKDKKRLNKEDVAKLNEFGLAVWYMDDGNVWNRKSRSSCITLNTQSFEREDIEFLIAFLKKKWDMLCTYNKSENTIRISSKSCPKFIKLVKPYMIPEMEYKTKLVHVKQGELLETLVVKQDNQQPSLGSNTLEGSTTNSRVHSVDSNADTSALQQKIEIKSRGLTFYPSGAVSGGFKSVDDIV